jgi:hypothetical protein
MRSATRSFPTALRNLEDGARIALVAGNFPAMIFRHYRELVTAETAKAGFAVRPAAGRKSLKDCQETVEKISV